LLGRISRFPTVDLLERPDETHPRRGRVSRFGMSAVAALMNALSKRLFPDTAAGWAPLRRFQLAGRRFPIDRTSFCRSHGVVPRQALNFSWRHNLLPRFRIRRPWPVSSYSNDRCIHSHSVGTIIGPYHNSSFTRRSGSGLGGTHLCGTAYCSHACGRSPPGLDPADLPCGWTRGFRCSAYRSITPALTPSSRHHLGQHPA
jgi:hypothetical protein